MNLNRFWFPRSIFRNIKDDGDLNIVLDCTIEILPDVLKQAQQVGVMTEKHNYIIASLVSHSEDHDRQLCTN